MTKTAYAAMVLSMLLTCPAWAQSPIPTFDKEAVTAIRTIGRAGRRS